jgi:N-acetylglucosamine-6-phosphate deacetylase
MSFLGFKNSKIYVYGKGIVETSLSIKNGKIFEIGGKNEGVKLPNNLMVIPGFVDKHTHGANHADFMNPTKEDLKKICGSVFKEGTTSLLATTMTQSSEAITASLKNIGEYIQEQHSGVEILGVHLEGPYVSLKYAGAQPPEYIIKCDIESFKKFNEASGNNIKQVSLACEENGLDFIKYLVENNIVASIGHSNSTCDLVIEAANMGASSITHTYNASRGIHHRDIGVTGAAMIDDRYSCELICDLIHVSAPAIKLLYKTKGKDNICLITDSIEAKYMPDGKYSLGGQPVFVENNAARLESGTLAGSTLKMNEGVRNFMNTLNLSIEDAVDCATINPARVLHVDDRKGSIEIGKDADLVVVDENLNIYMTICRGNVVYNILDK